MLRDSGARALLVRDAVPAPLAGCGLPVASLAALPAADGGPWPELGGGSLAYLVYTSGSTGRPKGTLITHRGVVRLARGSTYLQLRPGDRSGQSSTASFDASTWEIWAPLLNGATLVVIDRDDLVSTRRLERVVRERRLDSIFLTPAVFNQVAHEAPETLAPLRDVLTGGEAADPAAFARVLEACPGTRVLNFYGPSEITTYATWHEAERTPGTPASIPIGRAVPNTRVYVLDRALRPVPDGVAGELHVAGDGLARGYHGRPGLTAERFVPDPYAPMPGELMYRTGDRVRWHRGTLEFLGRVDDQVKVRGFRVEPGEIETALRGHPAVAEAAVVARPDGAGGRHLVAFVAPVHGGALATAELREHLATFLPAWMVPSVFVSMDALPKGPMGKVDRHALPEAAAPAAADDAGWAAPATETEEAVAAVWSEVLGLGRVGATDDFFDLGGHSLKATRILSRVAARLGVELPVGVIFDQPTVRGMAALVDERLGEAPDPDADLLEWLEGLTDEEAERLLAESEAGR
jgi:amino acid adenylation domain-containing protein